MPKHSVTRYCVSDKSSVTLQDRYVDADEVEADKNGVIVFRRNSVPIYITPVDRVGAIFVVEPDDDYQKWVV